MINGKDIPNIGLIIEMIRQLLIESLTDERKEGGGEGEEEEEEEEEEKE